MSDIPEMTLDEMRQLCLARLGDLDSTSPTIAALTIVDLELNTAYVYALNLLARNHHFPVIETEVWSVPRLALPFRLGVTVVSSVAWPSSFTEMLPLFEGLLAEIVQAVVIAVVAHRSGKLGRRLEPPFPIGRDQLMELGSGTSRLARPIHNGHPCRQAPG